MAHFDVYLVLNSWMVKKPELHALCSSSAYHFRPGNYCRSTVPTRCY